MTYVIFLLLFVGVVWLISAPLRRAAPHADEDEQPEGNERVELEAARDAKYREIRDAELDHQTAKLSDEDFAAIDSTLRAEAIALLNQLDAIPEQEEPDQGES